MVNHHISHCWVVLKKTFDERVTEPVLVTTEMYEAMGWVTSQEDASLDEYSFQRVPRLER